MGTRKTVSTPTIRTRVLFCCSTGVHARRPFYAESFSALGALRLVVDDHPAVLELLAEMLVELGCEVITQQDSAAALAVLAQDQRIGLLLTDINMPGIAGHELAKQAKRLRPGVKPILISGRETHGHGFPL
jgi:two-component system, cell cycle response regulator CpdR